MRLLLLMFAVASACAPSAPPPARKPDPAHEPWQLASFVQVPAHPGEPAVLVLDEYWSARLASTDSTPPTKCGIERPFGRTGTWTPSLALVGSVDSAVLRVVDSTMRARSAPPGSRAVAAHRQYMGVELFGRRYLHVNGAPTWIDKSHHKYLMEKSAGDRDAADLEFRFYLSQWLGISDAGWGQWSVVLEPETLRFGSVMSSYSFAGCTSPLQGWSIIPGAA